MLRAIAVCLFLIGRCAVAQVKPPLPEFDAATVKLNKSGANEASGGILPGGEFSVRNISMIDLLQFAWHVEDKAISGVQPWFRSDRFDVIGKAPANTSDPTLRLMLRSLLAREFKLKVLEEQKPQDAFALVVAKGGPTLQKSAGTAVTVPVAKTIQDDPNDHCKRAPGNPTITAICTNITMGELAQRLPSLAPAYVDRPVVDLTGISGTYDLKLEWVGKGRIDAEGGITIFDSITKQLGLKLEQRKVPMPGLAIDHIERLTEN